MVTHTFVYKIQILITNTSEYTFLVKKIYAYAYTRGKNWP